MAIPSVLIVDDEEILRHSLAERLQRSGYRVSEAGSANDALVGGQEGIDLAILDYRLPDMDGVTLLKKLKERDPDTLFILMTAYSSVENAVAAMKEGAFDYANKPFHLEEMAMLVAKALETTALRREVRLLRANQSEPYAIDRIIGESPPMRAVKALVARVAGGPASTVLLTGESGTGKDLVAKAIHYNSPRASRPFMNITCSALPDTLLESELFGHERGAFTDARSQKKGLLELSDGGTVFLDEVTETSAAFQAKLLRFVEDRAFKRVGGAADIAVDVRIVAATNRRIEEAVREGKFRTDLFYRLSVLPMALPALRERPGDIALLARHYLAFFARDFKRNMRGITEEALAAMKAYPWPGNVRELRNAIERAMLLCEGDELGMRDFPHLAAPGTLPSSGTVHLPPEGLDLAALERHLLVEALERTQGNQTRAAQLLGMKRDQIRYRVRKLGLGEVGRSAKGASSAQPPLLPLGR